MTEFRRVTEDFSVSPQIELADMAEAAAQGFTLVINNRPDSEVADQPTSAQMEAAALAAGMDYVHIPVTGSPSQEQIDLNRIAIEDADGPVLAFCRSGTRSIVTWSIGQALSGVRSRSELSALGRGAGYDLSGVLG